MENNDEKLLMSADYGQGRQAPDSLRSCDELLDTIFSTDMCSRSKMQHHKHEKIHLSS